MVNKGLSTSEPFIHRLLRPENILPIPCQQQPQNNNQPSTIMHRSSKRMHISLEETQSCRSRAAGAWNSRSFAWSGLSTAFWSEGAVGVEPSKLECGETWEAQTKLTAARVSQQPTPTPHHLSASRSPGQLSRSPGHLSEWAASRCRSHATVTGLLAIEQIILSRIPCRKTTLLVCPPFKATLPGAIVASSPFCHSTFSCPYASQNAALHC